jgi:AcrR family transcriptional regulator
VADPERSRHIPASGRATGRATGRGRRRLGPGDWAAAALAAIGEGGLAAVAVEPLATRLEATKGSFYWHFPNRDALVAAALQLWESQRTEAVITLMDAEPDPLERLRKLFAGAVDAGSRDRVEVCLLAAAQDPLVQPVLRRVTARRIDYVTRGFAELGLPAQEARARALIAFCAYLGNAQLAHIVPESLPDGSDQRRAYLDRTVALLTADAIPTPAAPAATRPA